MVFVVMVEVVVLIVMVMVEVVVLIVEVEVVVLVVVETVMAVGGFTWCDHRAEDRGRPCLAAPLTEKTRSVTTTITLNGSAEAVF